MIVDTCLNSRIDAIQPILTHLSIAPLMGCTLANSAEPDQMPQNVASDLVFHCLLTECTFLDLNEIKTYYSTTL